MENGILKPIPGFPGYYATENGRIWSASRKDYSGHCRKGKFLTSVLDRNGYYRVCLCINGKHYNRLVHRLILAAFSGPCPNKCCCRHLNGIKTDDRIFNLMWGTYKENQADCKLHGTNPIGERNPKAKLTEQDVKEIRQIYETQFHWGLRCKLAQIYNVTPQNIRCIVKRLTWKHI